VKFVIIYIWTSVEKLSETNDGSEPVFSSVDQS